MSTDATPALTPAPVSAVAVRAIHAPSDAASLALTFAPGRVRPDGLNSSHARTYASILRAALRSTFRPA